MIWLGAHFHKTSGAALLSTGINRSLVIESISRGTKLTAHILQLMMKYTLSQEFTAFSYDVESPY